MEDAGASAVVLHSLFEEEIDHESYALDFYLTEGTESFPEALSYFPDIETFPGVGPEQYLRHIKQAKEALDIPVIASLNGVSEGGWTQYASEIEAAGADALELNIYFIASSLSLNGYAVEQVYINVLKSVLEAVKIPVTVKLNPYFSATGHMAAQLAQEGASGLVLFNRFYQPDIDLELLDVVPNLILSSPSEMRLPLRWIAILHGQIDADLALTTGVHDYMGALKGVAAGANIVMMASELLRNGIGRISEVRDGMAAWLVEHEYESLQQLHGSMSQRACPAPAAFERANYVQTIGAHSPGFT